MIQLANTDANKKNIIDIKTILTAAKHLADIIDNPPPKEQSHIFRRSLYKHCQDFPMLCSAFNQQKQSLYQLSQSDRLALKQVLLSDYRQFSLQADVDALVEKRFNAERLPTDPLECISKMELMIYDEEKRIQESNERIRALSAAYDFMGVVAKNKRTAETFDETPFTSMPGMAKKQKKRG